MKNASVILLATLTSIAVASAPSDFGIGANISFDGGYRFDHYDQSGNAPATSTTYVRNKIKQIQLGTFDVAGRVTYDAAAYCRFVGRYGSIVTRPQREVVIDGTPSTSTIDNRGFAYDLSAAAGYIFDLFAGDFFIAPEFGYGYSRLKIGQDEYLGYGAPFFGLDLKWILVEVWTFGIHFDYYFTGTRREKLTPPISGITTDSSPLYLDKGRVQGPEGSLYFGHQFNDHWGLGLQYRLKYLFTNDRTVDGVSTTWNQKTAWTSNNISLKLSYKF